MRPDDQLHGSYDGPFGFIGPRARQQRYMITLLAAVRLAQQDQPPVDQQDFNDPEYPSVQLPAYQIERLRNIAAGS